MLTGQEKLCGGKIMRRTNYGPALREFFGENRRLLLFLLLFVTGTVLGVVVFMMTHEQLADDLLLMFGQHAGISGFQEGIAVLCASCLSSFVLLGLLFLGGLSAYGAPLAFLVPLFFGLGLGLTEAYQYQLRGCMGIVYVAVLVLPHTLVAAAGLLMGCAESLRMSVAISRQLLPGSTIGGLWPMFRMYCVRFLLFVGIALVSGVLDVCLQLIAGGLFST